MNSAIVFLYTQLLLNVPLRNNAAVYYEKKKKRKHGMKQSLTTNKNVAIHLECNKSSDNETSKIKHKWKAVVIKTILTTKSTSMSKKLKIINALNRISIGKFKVIK